MPNRPARAYLTTGPIGAASVLYEGTFADACKAVWALPLSARHGAHIHVEGYDYSPGEIEDMRPMDMTDDEAA